MCFGVASYRTKCVGVRALCYVAQLINCIPPTATVEADGTPQCEVDVQNSTHIQPHTHQPLYLMHTPACQWLAGPRPQ